MENSLSPLEYLINSLGSGLDKAVNNISSSLEMKDASRRQEAARKETASQRSRLFNNSSPLPGPERLPERPYYNPRELIDASVVSPSPSRGVTPLYSYGREGEDAEIGYSEALNIYRRMAAAPVGTFPKEQLDAYKELLQGKREDSKTLSERIKATEEEARNARRLAGVLSSTDFSQRSQWENLEHLVNRVNIPGAQNLLTGLVQSKKGALMDLISAKELGNYLQEFKGAVRNAEIQAFYKQALSAKNTQAANALIQTLMQGEALLKVEEGRLSREIINDYPGITPDRFEALLEERMNGSREQIGNWINSRTSYLVNPDQFQENDTRERVVLDDANPLFPPEQPPVDENNPLVPPQGPNSLPDQSIFPQQNSLPEEQFAVEEIAPEVLPLGSLKQQLSPFDAATTEKETELRSRILNEALTAPSSDEFVKGISSVFDVESVPGMEEALKELGTTREGRQVVKNIMEAKARAPGKSGPVTASARKNVKSLLGYDPTPEESRIFEAVFSLAPRSMTEVLDNPKTRAEIKKTTKEIEEEISTSAYIGNWMKAAAIAPFDVVNASTASLLDIPLNIGGWGREKLTGKKFNPNFLSRNLEALMEAGEKKQGFTPGQKKLRRGLRTAIGIGVTTAAALSTGGLSGLAKGAGVVGASQVLKWGIRAAGDEFNASPASQAALEGVVDIAMIAALSKMGKSNLEDKKQKAAFARSQAPLLEEAKALGIEIAPEHIQTPLTGKNGEVRTITINPKKANAQTRKLERSIEKAIGNSIAKKDPRLLDSKSPSFYFDQSEAAYNNMSTNPDFSNPKIGVPSSELVEALTEEFGNLFEGKKSLIASQDVKAGQKILGEVIETLVETPGNVTPEVAVRTLQTLRKEVQASANQQDPVKAQGYQNIVKTVSNVLRRFIREKSPELAKQWDNADSLYTLAHKKEALINLNDKISSKTPKDAYAFITSDSGKKQVTSLVGAEGYRKVRKFAEFNRRQDKSLARTQPGFWKKLLGKNKYLKGEEIRPIKPNFGPQYGEFTD